MLDFSKPASGTMNSMGVSANQQQHDKKDKKDKKEKKEKKDKKKDNNNSSINDRDDEQKREREQENKLPPQQAPSAAVSSSSSSEKYNNTNNNTLQQQLSGATPNQQLSFAAGGSSAYQTNSSFGFFSMNNNNTSNLHHNNNSNTTTTTNKSQTMMMPVPGIDQQQQRKSNMNNTTNNKNDDDEDLDSDIEEVDAGEGITASTKMKKNNNYNSRENSSNNNNNNTNNTNTVTKTQQKLSESERVKANQEAIQKQFSDMGLTKAIRNANGEKVAQSDENDDDGTVLDALNRIDVLAKMKHEDILEFVPRSTLLCNLKRQKGGFFDSNIYFQMYSEVGNHFILSARKRSMKTTTNFIISASDTSTSKKSEQFMGKVRGNPSKTQYIVYDQGDRPENGYMDEISSMQEDHRISGNNNNNTGLSDQQIGALGRSIELDQQLREELAYIMFAVNAIGSGGARKMFVILPKPDPQFGQPGRKYRPRNETETMKAHWKQDPSQFLTLENKEATWNEALRAYQLNFKGRVKCQSVKNFQLVESSNKNRVVLQVGKKDDDEFVVDFQAPLTAFMAMSIALTAFDGSMTRE